MDACVNKVVPDGGRPARDPVERPSRAEAEAAVRVLIAWAGDDPARAGLVDTPGRVTRAYEEFYAGYNQDAAEVLDRTFDDIGGFDDLVLVRDIPFVSHCEHHMIPFIGNAHIAYYPTDGVVGLSKLGRLVDVYAHRLQSQERMNSDILTALNAALKPRGTAVMLEAEHQCMTLRGALKPGTLTITTQYSGVFRDDPAEQSRFLSLIRGG